ncbi:MAG: class I SAM-dependent methyltransferase [Rudaea sp.]
MPFASGKRVLDAACGEGYGSALLATGAAHVTGLDISPDAVGHAKKRYGHQSNLAFDVGDCTKLDSKLGPFDLIVSFETLEHVTEQGDLVAGFARALTPDGILVISSPDKKTYSDERGYSNEFHVRELYRDELFDLLRPHFPFVRLYGQKLLFQSAIWNMESSAGYVHAVTSAGDVPQTGLNYAPLYFIAVCSRHALPDSMPGVALFGDREESVYEHYNTEVRRNMTAGHRIAELERELNTLRTATSSNPTIDQAPSPWWRRVLRNKR